MPKYNFEHLYCWAGPRIPLGEKKYAHFWEVILSDDCHEEIFVLSLN
jgi:hypothetical protein